MYVYIIFSFLQNRHYKNASLFNFAIYIISSDKTNDICQHFVAAFKKKVKTNYKIFIGTNTKLNKLKDGSNLISEIRGLGLMIGIQFSIDSSIVANKLFEKKLLTVGAGDNVIRLLPPLNITESEIDAVIDILKITLKEIQTNG